MVGFSMDEAFVQAPEHRSKLAVTEATGIPLIDLSPLTFGDAAAVAALAAEVGAASREWGFFLVVGHGVPPETVARATAAQRAFFALPAERKAALRRREAAPLGYYESEHTRNVRDWKEVFDLVAHEPSPPPPAGGVADGEVVVYKNKWPEDLPGFREALEEYMQSLEELAFKLLELLARSLNLSPDRLHGFFKPPTTSFRLNHYPPCPRPELALGVGQHTDYGALTIMYQDDVGGLDVRRRSDGEWVRVKCVPDSFIVNLGDTMQVWSNDRYQSAEHRVSVNAARARFSMPYFFNPAVDAVVEPLGELVGEDDPPRYSAYSWIDFFSTKLSGNYRKLAVENYLEIEHFRKGREV